LNLNPLIGRGKSDPKPGRGNGLPHSFTEVAMEIANRNTREDYIRDVLASLSDEDLEALKAWRRLADKDSRYLGGRGPTREQMAEGLRAWEALSPEAQRAHNYVHGFTVNELVDAIQEMGVPEDTGREIEAVWALLGPDYPAYAVLPASALVYAYQEALNLLNR